MINFPFQILLSVVYAVWCVLMIALPLSPYVPVVGMYLYAIIVILLFLCVAGLFVLTPYTTRKLFGQEYFAANFGLIFTAVVGHLLKSCI